MKEEIRKENEYRNNRKTFVKNAALATDIILVSSAETAWDAWGR